MGRGLMPSSVISHMPPDLHASAMRRGQQNRGSLSSREASVPPGDTGLQTKWGRKVHLQTMQHLAG